MSATEPELLIERAGPLAVLTLNRPQALNALTLGMVNTMTRALDLWEHDDLVQTVLIRGSGDRGLCAGGDIIALYHDAKGADGAASRTFWRDEYRLNARLANYSKPIVAIQDGIVLGGGIGISAHCSHRVVTERSRLGLPEVGIGFVPDVGATWLLSRSPGELGTAVALAGLHMASGDAIALGFSDYFVPAERLHLLATALTTEDATTATSLLAEEPPKSALAADRNWLDDAFIGDDVLTILARLRSIGEPAEALLRGIERSSPIAVAVTLAALRRAAELPDLESALTQEFRVSAHALRTHDFVEGIRAQVVDKDRRPTWLPASHDDVTLDDVAAYFSVPIDGDLHIASKETR